jgi:hypothetical protein
VEKWDEKSPQRLFRIAGELYQRDADFFYRVKEDRITVRLAEGVRDWNDLLAGVSEASPDDAEQLGRLSPGLFNRLGILDLELPGGDPTAWCRLLHGTGLVEYAEVVTFGVYLVVRDDPQYSEQWALNNTGQTGGTAGADVHAQEAWDLATGDPAVVVGILDSGTWVDHEDLAVNVWHNEEEIPDNGIDDDDNGFIDDWEGWDFGNDDNDPRSTNFHGTHVTGIINAATNNGIGISGVAGGWNGPGVRGMAVEGIGAPAFAGLETVLDPDPCGATGLELAWSAPPAWGSGGPGTCEVHRGATADFVPEASNRLASGVIATSWTDLGAPADTEVWYVVRTRNNESCSGGEGLTDGNLVRLDGTETLGQPIPGAVGHSVRLTRVGAAIIRLSWDAVPGADRYLVQRSASTDFSSPETVGTTSGTFFEDANAATQGVFHSYRVLAVNACGQGSP